MKVLFPEDTLVIQLLKDPGRGLIKQIKKYAAEIAAQIPEALKQGRRTNIVEGLFIAKKRFFKIEIRYAFAPGAIAIGGAEVTELSAADWSKAVSINQARPGAADIEF